jgi:hypothetical protein
MRNTNDLLKCCIEWAKAKNPALRSASKALIHTELLQDPYPTAKLGDLCIFTWKDEAGEWGYAGELFYVSDEELVFDTKPGQFRIWLYTATLVVTRVTVVAAPEMDILLASPSNRAIQKLSADLRKRLLAARKGKL